MAQKNIKQKNKTNLIDTRCTCISSQIWLP